MMTMMMLMRGVEEVRQQRIASVMRVIPADFIPE